MDYSGMSFSVDLSVPSRVNEVYYKLLARLFDDASIIDVVDFFVLQTSLVGDYGIDGSHAETALFGVMDWFRDNCSDVRLFPSVSALSVFNDAGVVGSFRNKLLDKGASGFCVIDVEGADESVCRVSSVVISGLSHKVKRVAYINEAHSFEDVVKIVRSVDQVIITPTSVRKAKRLRKKLSKKGVMLNPLRIGLYLDDLYDLVELGLEIVRFYKAGFTDFHIFTADKPQFLPYILTLVGNEFINS